MTLDDHLAALRGCFDAEIRRARNEGIVDLLEAAAEVRSAVTETERAAAMQKFADNPSAIEFLNSLAPQPAPQEERNLRAQRFARVRVAEIQLYQASQVKNGRASANIYGAVSAQIDAAREAYRENFLTPTNGSADYLHAELVRTLANDDAALLGPGYPGPLV